MKAIRIKHFCRLPLWFVLLLAVAVPLCVVCFVYGVVKSVPELIAIGALELGVFTVGFGFYFNYGITISKKWVVILYFNTLRVFKWDDISRFEIGFDEESVWGEIKAKKQKAYTFYLDEFELSSSADIVKLKVKVKLTKRYADKLEKRLAATGKIKVNNRFY